MSADALLLQAILEADEADAIAALGRGASPEAFDATDGLRALALAARENLPSLVRALLAAGAAVDAAGPDGTRALDLAMGRAKLEVLQTLLEAGANPNLRSPDRAPVVYVAAGEPETLRLLLRAGAEPDLATEAGETALSFAVSWGHLASIRVLLAGGADPNHVVRTDDGFEWSILCFAAQEGDADVVAALLEAGADATWSNERGKTAASVAFDHAQPDAWRLLVGSAAGYSEPVRGLRGRLSIAKGDAEVDLELWNVSQDALSLTIDEPTALAWSLLCGGRELRPWSMRMDVLSCPRAVTLEPGDLVRWRVSSAGERERGVLDLVTAIWKRPSSAESALLLRCTWTAVRESNAEHANPWIGQLTLEARLLGEG